MEAMNQLRLKIKEKDRAWMLYLIQLALTSLMGIPVYVLAPLIETTISAHRLIDSPMLKAIFRIISGGLIVFAVGILIDRN
jgi:hypothetical protein